MKKLLLSITFTLILLMNITSVAFASATEEINANEEYIVAEEFEEITDLDVLYQRAKNGVNEDMSVNIDLKLNAVNVSPLGPGLETEDYTTSQLLKVETNDDGEVMETYATTTFTDVYDTSNVSINPYGSGSSYQDQLDPTLGLRAYSTVYYNTLTKSGVSHRDLTKVSGGWSILDSKYAITNQKVTYGAKGWSRYEGGTNGQSATKYPNGRTFSYTVPSSWNPVASTGGNGQTFGVTTFVKIHKPNYSWNYTFTNNIIF